MHLFTVYQSASTSVKTTMYTVVVGAPESIVLFLVWSSLDCLEQIALSTEVQDTIVHGSHHFCNPFQGDLALHVICFCSLRVRQVSVRCNHKTRRTATQVTKLCESPFISQAFREQERSERVLELEQGGRAAQLKIDHLQVRGWNTSTIAPTCPVSCCSSERHLQQITLVLYGFTTAYGNYNYAGILAMSKRFYFSASQRF